MNKKHFQYFNGFNRAILIYDGNISHPIIFQKIWWKCFKLPTSNFQ